MSAPQKTQQPPPRWRGDEVEPRHGDEAELAADRAEGNARVRADVEAARQHEVESEPPARAPASDEDPEDEIRDAAEEHRARNEAEGYPPRGKL